MKALKELADRLEEKGEQIEAARLREGIELVVEVGKAIQADYPDWDQDKIDVVAAITTAGLLK